MITGKVITKGLIMCRRYICGICGYEFYWPINEENKNATIAVNNPICPKCNSNQY
jgi:DNA-directed RNA polymerase subunit RPC12/RpoP